MGRYEDAIKAYDELLRRDPTHADARHNKQQIEDWLQRQQQQQQQQAGQQQGDEQEQQGQGESRQPGSPQAQNDADGDSQAQSPGDNGNEEAQPSAGSSAEQQSAESAGEAGEEPAGALADLDRQMSEQATEQWLRKIPDDPGGLLRHKFLYQYRERGGVDKEAEPW